MIDFCFPFLIWIGGQTEFRIGATRSSFVVEMFEPSIHLRIGSAASITPAMISSILHVCIVKQPLPVCSCWQSILGAARQEMNEKQHISSNTTDDFPSCMCLVKCARGASFRCVFVCGWWLPHFWSKTRHWLCVRVLLCVLPLYGTAPMGYF